MEAGNILLKKGLLDERQLEQSRRAQADGMRLDETAVQLGFLTEESALRALGDEVGGFEIFGCGLAEKCAGVAAYKGHPWHTIDGLTLDRI